jgi:hypothetical protein
VADPTQVTDITLGEVYRLQLAHSTALESIKQSIDKRPTWEAIDRLEDARDAEQGQQNVAIKALEDANRWLVRTVGAALVTGVAGLAGVVINSGRIG